MYLSYGAVRHYRIISALLQPISAVMVSMQSTHTMVTNRSCMKICTEKLQTPVIQRNKQGGDNMAVSTMNILIICVTILLFAIITKNDKNDKDGEE